MENFPSHPLLSYALEVEKVTTAKVRNSSKTTFQLFQQKPKLPEDDGPLVFLHLLHRHKQGEGEGADDENHGEDEDEPAHEAAAPTVLRIVVHLIVLKWFILASFEPTNQPTYFRPYWNSPGDLGLYLQKV